MKPEEYYKMMRDKVVELEENMTQESIYERMKNLEKIGKELKQHPIEFYFCINDYNYKQSVIKKLNLRPEDVVLDIGSGVADLPFMIKDKVKQIYAVEVHKDIYELAYPYIKNIPNISFINTSFQDFKFPKDVTKCIMLAWHCTPITFLQILNKLKGTDCRLFIHNFGKTNSIQVKTATQINSADSL